MTLSLDGGDMQLYDCTIDSVDQLEHLLDAQDGLVTTLANAEK